MNEKETLLYINDLCREAAQINSQMSNMKEEYELIGCYISDIQLIKDMNEDKRKELISYAKMADILERDKEAYKDSTEIVVDMDYQIIDRYEQDIPKILKNMREDEQRYTMVRDDLRKLDGEKHALKMEHAFCLEKIKNCVIGIKAFVAVMLVSFFAFLILGLVFNADFLVAMYIIETVCVIAVILLFSARKRQKDELTLIQAKLKKAVGLQNKIKLKYVNVYTGLDYMYEKYDVGSSNELIQKVNDYQKVQRNKETYRNTAKRLYEVTESITHILEDERLYDANIWLTQLDALYDEAALEKIASSLYSQRQGLKRELERFSEKLEEIRLDIKDKALAGGAKIEDVMSILQYYDVQ